MHERIRAQSCRGAALKSVVLGLIILATASLIVPIRIEHPFVMLGFLVLMNATAIYLRKKYEKRW